jgi:hypothetical protein
MRICPNPFAKASLPSRPFPHGPVNVRICAHNETASTRWFALRCPTQTIASPTGRSMDECHLYHIYLSPSVSLTRVRGRFWLLATSATCDATAQDLHHSAT